MHSKSWKMHHWQALVYKQTIDQLICVAWGTISDDSRMKINVHLCSSINNQLMISPNYGGWVIQMTCVLFFVVCKYVNAKLHQFCFLICFDKKLLIVKLSDIQWQRRLWLCSFFSSLWSFDSKSLWVTFELYFIPCLLLLTLCLIYSSFLPWILCILDGFFLVYHLGLVTARRMMSFLMYGRTSVVQIYIRHRHLGNLISTEEGPCESLDWLQLLITNGSSIFDWRVMKVYST